VTYEIIVVDDNVRAGESFAKLIQTATGLMTAYTDDPRQAIELIKENPIKVAVLDQRMPKKTGTALFEDLKKFNPELRGILFSGEAERDDLAEALRAGFIDELGKDDVSQLPERVRRLHLEALADIANRQYAKPERIGEHRPRLTARRPRVTVDLLAFEDSPGSPKEVWLESDLSVAVRLEGGQTKRISRSRITESEIIREDESTVTKSRTASATGGLALTTPMKANVGSQLQSKLESSLRERAQERNLTRYENVEEETFELPIPATEADPRAREILRAPIYRRMRAIVRISCGCCNTDKYEILNVRAFTGRYHTRHVDHLGDGNAKVVDFQ
jgi:DNA-binding NarL/FixJ family response regulator